MRAAEEVSCCASTGGQRADSAEASRQSAGGPEGMTDPLRDLPGALACFDESAEPD